MPQFPEELYKILLQAQINRQNRPVQQMQEFGQLGTNLASMKQIALENQRKQEQEQMIQDYVNKGMLEPQQAVSPVSGITFKQTPEGPEGKSFILDLDTKKYYYDGKEVPASAVNTKVDKITPVSKSGVSKLADVRQQQVTQKGEQFRETNWQKLGKAVNVLSASSRSALGVAASSNMRADRLLRTLQEPGATSQDIANAVADIQAVYKGGVPDQISMAHGDYPSFNRKLSEIVSYITSKPQSANSPEIQKRLVEIAKELKTVDNKVIGDNIGINADVFQETINTDPERWKRIIGGVTATTETPVPTGGQATPTQNDPLGIMK